MGRDAPKCRGTNDFGFLASHPPCPRKTFVDYRTAACFGRETPIESRRTDGAGWDGVGDLGNARLSRADKKNNKPYGRRKTKYANAPLLHVAFRRTTRSITKLLDGRRINY